MDRAPPATSATTTPTVATTTTMAVITTAMPTATIKAVRQPRGFWLAALTIDFAALVIGSITYYSYEGVYYQPTPGGYVVVDPPLGV